MQATTDDQPRPESRLRSALRSDGSLLKSYEPRLTEAELLYAYRAMLRSRISDERCFSLQRQGRMGTFSTVEGEEAAIVGSAMALDPSRDWIVPQYRELPAMLHMGYSLTQFLLYFMGNPAGGRIPDDVNLLPFQISLAAQVPHAVGLAWGLRQQGSDGVVVVYFGEGASSEGDVHEAMNLAGVRRAPVIFLLKNNGWAISTPVREQTATESFALRAPGYGFPGELVDGNDLFAVHDACQEAVGRARDGLGPTLIECRTWRLGPHNTADDPTRYVKPDELETAREADPLLRMRKHLDAVGLLDEAGEERLREELKAEVDAAVAEAEALPRSRPEQIFEHVYSNPPARMMSQWEEVR